MYSVFGWAKNIESFFFSLWAFTPTILYLAARPLMLLRCWCESSQRNNKVLHFLRVQKQNTCRKTKLNVKTPDTIFYFRSASLLFRNSLVIQVTWRYVTWPNQPIVIRARNMEASVNRQLSSDFVCLCLGKETISFILFIRVFQNLNSALFWLF